MSSSAAKQNDPVWVYGLAQGVLQRPDIQRSKSCFVEFECSLLWLHAGALLSQGRSIGVGLQRICAAT